MTHGSLVLSLFPGIGLLDRAFEEEGFCVVRGPDLLWGGDVKRFHVPSRKFDGVIGGPPCQYFSRLRFVVEANGFQTAPNLIPEFERIVFEAFPYWFLMENVPTAPTPRVEGYCTDELTVNNRWFGADQNRERKFVFGAHYRTTPKFRANLDFVALESMNWTRAVTCDARQVPIKIGGNGRPKDGGIMPHVGPSMSLSEMCSLQGLPADFLEHAPFTMQGKRKAVGNGVPLPMGRAIAKAVKACLEASREEK